MSAARPIYLSHPEVVIDPAVPVPDWSLSDHGAVGTLAWCALAGQAIDRRHDQPCGGCVWSAEGPELRPATGWQRLEDVLRQAAPGGG